MSRDLLGTLLAVAAVLYWAWQWTKGPKPRRDPDAEHKRRSRSTEASLTMAVGAGLCWVFGWTAIIWMLVFAAWDFAAAVRAAGKAMDR